MDKKALFKQLLPGFLPIIIFIAADEIWGTKVGLIVAVIFGILELIYTYFKEKRFDKFILFDTALLVALGLISIILNNEIFFKLKPALIGVIICAVLGISAFSSHNLMLLMSKRYLKDVQIDSNQLKALNRSIKTMFYLFGSYTILVTYSAFYMSNEAWAFISGGLFYILFGVYFVYELINNKLKQNKFKNEEWLPIVDEEGKVLGKAPRSVCHSDKNLLHPVVHLHVINKQNRIFLQKRPMFKKVQPGKWDTAVGGHISFNETLEQSLKRETFEEIGISDFNAKLIGTYKWESDIETELVYMFITNYNNGIKINNKELDKGKFWSINQINKNLGLGVFTPNFELEFDILKKQVLH